MLLHRFVLAGDGGELSLFSTVTTFGTASDITLAELSIEAFYPADSATRAALQAHAERRQEGARASAR